MSHDTKFAILGDIHSNWEALQCVLEDARSQGVSDFLCVGDVVGYNADPCRCLNEIRNLGCLTVRGNHDYYCSNNERLNDFQPLAASVVDWTRRQLSDEQAKYLRALPQVSKVQGFTLVHSTLDTPERWGYVFDCLDAEANFAYQSTAVCFYGHTHLPVLFEREHRVTRMAYLKTRLSKGKRYFINVGSVGQPRDGDPRSAYAIYQPATRDLELRRLVYDVATTQEKVRRAQLPERLAIRLALGK